MENYIPKAIQPKVIALGIYQILGGLIGIGLTVWLIGDLPGNSFPILIILIAIALNAYSIYCGILLLKKTLPALNIV